MVYIKIDIISEFFFNRLIVHFLYIASLFSSKCKKAPVLI